MFAGMNPAVVGLGVRIPPPTPEQEKAAALSRVSEAAARHAEAIREASEGPGLELVPQALVDAILAAGRALDEALTFAVRHHVTPGELADVSGLHPTYVRELLEADKKWPA
jgi:hypothetical protein